MVPLEGFSNKYSLKIGLEVINFNIPTINLKKKDHIFLKILIQKILNSKDII